MFDDEFLIDWIQNKEIFVKNCLQVFIFLLKKNFLPLFQGFPFSEFSEK